MVRFYGSFLCCLLLLVSAFSAEAGDFVTDKIETARGDIEITFIGHGTLMLQFGGQVIHVDPVGRQADYAKLPKADLILVTHEHYDHLDSRAIGLVSTPKTEVILTAASAEQGLPGKVLGNGDRISAAGLTVEAVPAYNIVHRRDNGQPFHPKGHGNGYIITLGDKRIYLAGDTEDIPEMQNLTGIDLAFLPMNLPYTMTPEMTAAAALAFMPKILYPYHYGETDPNRLVELLQEQKAIEVRVRPLR